MGSHHTFIGLLIAAALVFAAPHVAAQDSQGTVPEGWNRLDPVPGRVAALRHPESLAFIEAARLDVDKDDLDAARSELETRLRETGFIAEGLSEEIAVGGKKGLKYRYSCEIEGFVFNLVVVEVHAGNRLWQVSALFRPTDDHPTAIIDKDLTDFANSLIAPNL